MKTRHHGILVLAVAALAVAPGPLAPAQTIDRGQEKSPAWGPPGTRDTEGEYPSRIGAGQTPFTTMPPSDVSEARNPRLAASMIDKANRTTTPHDLDVYRKDGQPGVGYSVLSIDPRDAASDRSGRTLVEQGLAGQNLNNDPRSVQWLGNGFRQLSLSEVVRSGSVGFGSTKFVRIEIFGDLAASVGAGTANHRANARLVGTFFRKTREIASATLESKGPPTPGSVKTATLKLDAFGRTLVNETVSDTKPFARNLRGVELAPLREWWSGSVAVPWLGLGMAFKMTSDPVKATPRVAIGNASATGEVGLRSGLELLGEVPLVSVFSFASIVARVHFRPLDGGLIGGGQAGLVWDAAGRPKLRDARFVRSELSYGAVNLKIKAVWGFKVFGWSLWHDDKTLWSVFKHDGRKVEKEILSHVREIALR